MNVGSMLKTICLILADVAKYNLHTGIPWDPWDGDDDAEYEEPEEPEAAAEGGVCNPQDAN